MLLFVFIFLTGVVVFLLFLLLFQGVQDLFCPLLPAAAKEFF